MLIWLIGPALIILSLKIVFRDCGKSLGLRLNLKKNKCIYLLSIIIFPAIYLIIFLIGKITGTILKIKVILNTSGNKFLAISITFGFLLVSYIIKNVFEEIAWRGFLTERLINLKCSDVFIYLTTAIVWATWHIPYYLFFLKIDNPWETIFTNYIVLLSWIIMFVEIYRISRSIWPCVIMHAFSNSLAVFSHYINVKQGFEWLLSYNCGLIQIIICIAVGLLLRKYRINNISENNEELYDDAVNKLI